MSKLVYRPIPTPGRVVVRVIEPPQTSGPIILISNRERPSTCGEVVAVGGDYNLDGIDYTPLFKVGDVVVFGQYSGIELSVGRDRVIVLEEKALISWLIPVEVDDDSLPSAPLIEITAAPR